MYNTTLYNVKYNMATTVTTTADDMHQNKYEQESRVNQK